jgi:E3 ubiquitin-protein ligase UBR1
VAAISTVVHKILMICTLSDDRLDRNKFLPISFHDVVFGGTSYHIIQFDVLEEWVSFHHSLHWLLAELFKHVDILSEDSLRKVGLSNLREIVLRNANEQAMLTVIDFPLRVLAMIAQIRTGLWVRNGFAIRGQLLHYRDFMLRELCYDQDIFVLQAAFIILDPNTVIVSILDRFGLLGYFNGAILDSPYEGPQLSSMVEEVLYLLITLFSENANASKMPLRVAVRREIVHALAMGPCSYTDLVKRVAERMVDDICFERVLKEVANFKAPESTTDSGVYELKDEVFDEVNPFFYHYTRNKREEVEPLCRTG